MNTDLMTTEQQLAKEWAAVMLAFAEGKKIQVRRKNGTWYNLDKGTSPRWEWNDQDYRIAPDQEAPFATPEMLATLPGGPDKWERVREGESNVGDWGIWIEGTRSERINVRASIKGCWESPDGGVVHVYRRKEYQLPPIPDGYELLHIGVFPPPVGWMIAIPGADGWLEIKESRPFTQLMDGVRFIRPIRKPKMPNGTFWIKSPKEMQAMLVVAVEEDKIFYIKATSEVACGTYGRSTIEQDFATIARLNELGYKWSHDRETWNAF